MEHWPRSRSSSGWGQRRGWGSSDKQVQDTALSSQWLTAWLATQGPNSKGLHNKERDDGSGQQHRGCHGLGDMFNQQKNDADPHHLRVQMKKEISGSWGRQGKLPS